MGMAVARLGDPDSGHKNCGSGVLVKSSNNVIANNKGVARLGDKFSPHPPCRGKHKCCCEAVVSKSSRTVIVNNRGVARLGDMNSCTAVIVSGSPNVISG